MTDILATKRTTDGTVYSGRTRVRAISWSPAAGNILLKDGGASGTTLIDIDTGAASTTYMELPGDGVLFRTDVYLDVTTITSVTVFYG